MIIGSEALFSHMGSKIICLINSISTFAVDSARATAKLGIGPDTWHPQSDLGKEEGNVYFAELLGYIITHLRRQAPDSGCRHSIERQEWRFRKFVKYHSLLLK